MILFREKHNAPIFSKRKKKNQQQNIRKIKTKLSEKSCSGN